MLLSKAFQSLRVLCLAGILLSTNALAQTNTTSQKSIGIDLVYHGYMSNYEYFSPVVPGFTLFGNILEPTFTFKPDSSWTLFAGAWLQQDFGRSGFRRAEPNVCLQYNRKKFNFRFGNIDVYNQHALPSFMYDGDDVITRGPAYGEQIKINGYRFKADQWIAWRRMIYLESIDQERIEGGINLKLNLTDSVTSWRAYVPANGIILHSGGQIGHIDTSQHVVTLYAVSGGLGFSKHFNSSLKTIGIEGIAAYCNNEDDARLPIGKAFTTKAFATLKHGISVEMAWWVGDNFYIPTGTPLYQSRSSIYAHDTAYFNQRNLLFLTLQWNYEPVKNLNVGAWVQPYYDINLELMEYGYRLRLTYNFGTTLKRFN